MWDCRYCASINRKRWRAHILTYLNSEIGKQKKWSFNTITVPRYIHRHAIAQERTNLSLDFIRKQWDKLIKRLKRAYGDFSYMRVLEQHQSGVLHIHLLMSIHHQDLHTGVSASQKPYSYSPLFKGHLTALGFGYITNSQNILDENGEPANAGLVVGYVTKYMTKYSGTFAEAVKGKRARRILVSRDIGSPKPQESEDDWWLRNGLYLMDIEIANEHGRRWIDLNTGLIITEDEFVDSDVYPPELE